jgi:hypothetical protein
MSATITSHVASQTFHEGAELERRAFKAYLRRMLKTTEDGPTSDQRTGVQVSLKASLRFVQGRCDRYKKRKGGL